MSLSPSNITKGGQITAYRFKMFNQVNAWFSFWVLLIFVVCSVLGFYKFTSDEILDNGVTYELASNFSSLDNLLGHGGAKTFNANVYKDGKFVKKVPLSLEEVLKSEYMKSMADKFMLRLQLFVGIGAGVACLIYSVLMLIIGRIGKKETDNEYISGMKLTDSPKLVNKMLEKNNAKSDLKIGDLHLIKNSEIQNILLHGTVGTGKSTVIRHILNYIKSRGDRFIIYDSGGTFVESHYNPDTDYILNAHDERCANWDLWAECEEVVDYENVANALIPEEGKSDPFWVSSSRTIFSDSAMRMSSQENRSIEEFLKVILSLSLKNLRDFLRNTPSANLVEEKIEKTAISIRSVTTNYAKSLRFLQGVDKGQEKFAIKNWMADEKYSNSGLFISTTEKHRDSTRPLISMWLSMATKNLQSMGENRDRRVWFIIDELPSLQRLPGLLPTISEARKFGGCFILGLQNMSQMTNTYGRETGEAISDLLNTRLYGRSPSASQAKEVEEELGHQRRWEAKEQNSFGLDQVRDGISIGRDKVLEPIVDYEDIMSASDLTFYVRLPGKYPVIKLEIKYKNVEKKNIPIVERKFKDSLSPLVERLIYTNERGMATDYLYREEGDARTEENKSTSKTREVSNNNENDIVNNSKNRYSSKFIDDTANEDKYSNINHASSNSRREFNQESVTAVHDQGPDAKNENIDDILARFERIRAKSSQAKGGNHATTEINNKASEQEKDVLASDVVREKEQVGTVTDISHMVEDTGFSKHESNTGKSFNPRKFRITGQTGTSDSENDSSQQQLTASISIIDDKMVITDGDEVAESNSKAVNLMAEEEKNILRHRMDKTTDNEEVEL